MSPPCRLTIVRHGQTSANIDGVWHGSTNTPLTDHGHRQAAAAAESIYSELRATERSLSRVYASPLDRTHHTARAIAERWNLVPELVGDLVEYDLGAWEGETFASLYKERKLFDNMRADPDYRPHGGESPRQVGDRLASALRGIAERHRGEDVAVVSHGGALSIAFGLILDGSYREWNRMMDNCAITELVLEPTPDLIRFNETSHLPPKPEV